MASVMAITYGTAWAQPAAGISAIAVYNGSWKSEITHLDTPQSKSGAEWSTLRNECWRSGDFYVCHQFVDGASKAVIVFSYNAKTNSYTTYPISPDADSVHAGKLLIDGNTWTFPWQVTVDGKTTQFRVVNVFTDANTIEFREEYSEDQSHWIAMATGSEHRTSPAR